MGHGWKNDDLKDAVEAIISIPELNSVLEHESARLAQNVVSAISGRVHEDKVAALVNDECKKVLARSMLVGLQTGMDRPSNADMRAFGASDAACYKWPEDTSEHKALRAAYMEGAADCGGQKSVSSG